MVCGNRNPESKSPRRKRIKRLYGIRGDEIEHIVKNEYRIINTMKKYEYLTNIDIQHYEEFRNDKNVKKCAKCGRRMKGELHHFVCQKCHDKIYGSECDKI
jgi:ABC-type ATPase with predicted acetyltransferase domain